jgi:NADP-dependent 3-hydroxy acid dehydrogenase YdfG
MTKNGSGSIFFTGASAGVKGFPNSSVFAMGKFGLRGLAQSLARELQPKNIHVAHFVIDGGISSELRPDTGEQTLLNPDEIAKTYLHFHRQDRSVWSWEIELRPWVEKF